MTGCGKCHVPQPGLRVITKAACFKETSFSSVVLFLVNSAVVVGEALSAVLSWPLPLQSLQREASEHKSVKLSVSRRPLYQTQTGLDIFKHYSWFSKLRNSVSQIPLTCREFRGPDPIMALEAPPNICAVVSARLGVLALSERADVRIEKHHCSWLQFIGLRRRSSQ